MKYKVAVPWVVFRGIKRHRGFVIDEPPYSLRDQMFLKANCEEVPELPPHIKSAVITAEEPIRPLEAVKKDPDDKPVERSMKRKAQSTKKED